VPVGFGMGMSAAGALSLSLSLNEEIGTGMRREECIKIAHDADVECKCGLSGVDAAAIGGMLARRSLAAMEVEKLPFEEKSLEFAFFKPIKTASVIGSAEWKQRVNVVGEKALSALFSSKTFDTLLAGSRQFSRESGLAAWCSKEMEENPRACMAMVGQTLFSDVLLSLRRKPLILLKAKTYESGAGLV